MKRLLAPALAIFAIAILVMSASAERHDNGDNGPMNKKKCEEMGGYWVNENGVKSCNTWQAVDDHDDIGTDDGVELGEFVAVFPDPDKIDSISKLTQQGNVGAPGTSPPELSDDEDVIQEFSERVLRCFRKISDTRLVEVSTAPCEAALKRQPDER